MNKGSDLVQMHVLSVVRGQILQVCTGRNRDRLPTAPEIKQDTKIKEITLVGAS